MSKTAFVTGGTGFLGINLVKSLCQGGWKVTALHRKSSDLTYIKELPVDLVEGSITDKETLRRVMPEDLDVVFHVAGDTKSWSKYRAVMTAIHVDGTRNMIDVAVEKRAKTFIHTSSVSVWGKPSQATITEESPQLGGKSWITYEKTKWQAEKIALQGVEKGLKVISINPGAIVGAHDTRTYGSLFFLLRDGDLPGIAPATLPMIHVDDVVQAHIKAVEYGRNGHRYIIVGEHISMSDLVGEAAQLMGIEKIPPIIPPILLKLAGRIGVMVARITGKDPSMTPEAAAMLSRKGFKFSNSKALEELHISITPWREGVKDCYDWLKREGLL